MSLIENKGFCARCDTSLTMSAGCVTGVIKGIHEKYGIYYQGPPVCGVCSNNLFYQLESAGNNYMEEQEMYHDMMYRETFNE